MLESKVQAQEQRMMDEINRRVAHAVAELAQSEALPIPNTASPSQRLLSSCASTGVPDAQTPRLPVEEQRFPMDAITQRTSCELHAPVGNLTIKVAYGSALATLVGQSSHGMEIPPHYASVCVEQIVDSQYEGLELDLPGGDGKNTLADALHGIILCGSLKEPAPPLKKSRAPPPKQRQRKKKTKEPEVTRKERWEAMSHVEQWAEIQREASEWFKKQAKEKKAREMEPPPVSQRDLNFFIKMEEGAKKRIPLLSNYERALVKAHEKDKRKGKSSSSGPIPDLSHLSKKDAQRVKAMPLDQQANVLKLMEETGLGLDECIGQVRKLSTKMYAFHQWYMMASADSREMIGMKVKLIHFHGEGEKVLWLDFKDIYEVYHHDALDVSLISAWTCHREAYLHVGFMDPSVVNQQQIQLVPEKTFAEVYNFLDKQTFKDFILLLYNFKSGGVPRSARHARLVIILDLYLYAKEERVAAICEGLIGFIMDEVVNPKGEFYYDGRQLDTLISNTTTGRL
uniref:DUF8039 domain-containing protein n=1 Tax=Setaria viridis TaxID=4556 RepID=A0A4U6TQZ8_SETVI|nr:hypothetical protein SEVIR_7G023800v2 [Setaria viridis]